MVPELCKSTRGGIAYVDARSVSLCRICLRRNSSCRSSNMDRQLDLHHCLCFDVYHEPRTPGDSKAAGVVERRHMFVIIWLVLIASVLLAYWVLRAATRS